MWQAQRTVAWERAAAGPAPSRRRCVRLRDVSARGLPPGGPRIGQGCANAANPFEHAPGVYPGVMRRVPPLSSATRAACAGRLPRRLRPMAEQSEAGDGNQLEDEPRAVAGVGGNPDHRDLVDGGPLPTPNTNAASASTAPTAPICASGPKVGWSDKTRCRACPPPAPAGPPPRRATSWRRATRSPCGGRRAGSAHALLNTRQCVSGYPGLAGLQRTMISPCGASALLMAVLKSRTRGV